MQVKGHEAGLAQEIVSLERGNGRPAIAFLITALPMGFMEEVREAIPVPIPQLLGFARKAGGGVLRAPDGSAVRVTDEKTPKFQTAEAEANKLQGTLMVVKGLEQDPNVVFDTTCDNTKSKTEYAGKLFEELMAFGFSYGDFGTLLTEVLRVSNLTDEKMQEVREAFLPEGAEAP